MRPVLRLYYQLGAKKSLGGGFWKGFRCRLSSLDNSSTASESSDPARTMGGVVIRKGKVFYGQERPSGEYTTTEYGFNYQLLAVMY